MSSRVKVMTLLLKNGSLDGPLTVEDSTWNSGSLLSCPRESISQLLENERVNNYGVYLLLSTNKVYVGQASTLKKRINQHLIGKDWWERVIVLTTKDNSFNKSDIDYIESVLIYKSTECGTLDSDNKNKGNRQKVDEFREAILNEYIDEALFILKLIGVNAFSKEGQNGKAIIPSIPTNSHLNNEKRNKKEVLTYLKQNGICFEGYVSYAKLQENTGYFWNNARAEEVSNEWDLILNNQVTKQLIILHFQPNAFKVSPKKQKGAVCLRSDKKQYLDLNINANNLIDKASGIDFSQFILSTLKY